jgi:hypothetical protein
MFRLSSDDLSNMSEGPCDISFAVPSFPRSPLASMEKPELRCQIVAFTELLFRSASQITNGKPGTDGTCPRVFSQKVKENRCNVPSVPGPWSFTPPLPTLRFPNGPALLYAQISRMTIIKIPTSYFACASFVTTAASLSSIWFQPSI